MTTCHLHTASVQLAVHLRPDKIIAPSGTTTLSKIRQKARAITRRYVISKSPFADAQMWSLGEELCFYKVSVEIVFKKRMHFSWWMHNKIMLSDGR